MQCLICQKNLQGKQSKFCSKECKSKGQSNACYNNQKNRAKKRKQELVDSLGGKCSMCGYSKCLHALQFHHLDPSKKDFNLDSRKISNTNIEAIKEELKKCILVCANCHAEIHWNN